MGSIPGQDSGRQKINNGPLNCCATKDATFKNNYANGTKEAKETGKRRLDIEFSRFDWNWREQECSGFRKRFHKNDEKTYIFLENRLAFPAEKFGKIWEKTAKKGVKMYGFHRNDTDHVKPLS